MKNITEIYIDSLMAQDSIESQCIDREHVQYARLVNYIASVQHNYLALRYALIEKMQQTSNVADISKNICVAHELAQILINCYDLYLNQPEKSKLCRTDIATYDRLLRDPGASDRPKLRLVSKDETHSKLEENTPWKWAAGTWLLWNQSLNLLRLLIGRLRNVFRFICLTMDVGSSYSMSFKILDAYIGPVLAQLSWAFFLPRLIIEFSNKSSHIWFPSSQEEESLGISARLEVHFKENWYDLLVWMSWCLCGLAICFLLPGEPVAIGFLSLGVQAAEVMINVIRYAIEHQRFYDLRCVYENLKSQDPEIQIHLTYLEKRRQAESYDLYYNILSNALFLIAIGLMLPASAIFCPALPIIGSVLSVLTTLAWIYYVKIERPTQQENEFLQPMPENIGIQYEKKVSSVNGGGIFLCLAKGASRIFDSKNSSPTTITGLDCGPQNFVHALAGNHPSS